MFPLAYGHTAQFCEWPIPHACAQPNLWWPKSVTAQTRTSRHKQKLHGTNKNFATQTKTSRHKQKLSWHKRKLSRHKQKLSRHKQKLHGTNKNSHSTNINSHGGNGCVFHSSGYSVTQNMAESTRKEDEDSEESLCFY